MAAIPTIAETIEIGDISIFLAGNDNDRGNLFGKRLAAPTSPVTIAIVTDALRWENEADSTDDTLRQVANYLLWLCGRYRLTSLALLGHAQGGGTVIPGGGGGVVTMPNPLDWIVSDTISSAAPLGRGDSTVYLNGTFGNVDFRGYNIDFFRGGQPQYTTDPRDGSTWYYWNKTSGLFIIYGAAQEGEPMRISPI